MEAEMAETEQASCKGGEFLLVMRCLCTTACAGSIPGFLPHLELSSHIPSLPACITSTGQAWEPFSGVPDQEAQQWSKFWKVTTLLLVTDTPRWKTHHGMLNLCVWLVLILILLIPQESGTSWPVFLLLLFAALFIQGMFSKAKLKNTSTCPWLHMGIELTLVSIGSEIG